MVQHVLNKITSFKQGGFFYGFSLPDYCKRKEVKRMIENDKQLGDILEKITADEARRKSRDRLAELARIRQETADIRRVLLYQNIIDSCHDEGIKQVDQVIQPWFSALTESGTYVRLLDWSKANQEDVYLSTPVRYYWPEKALERMRMSEGKSLLSKNTILAISRDEGNGTETAEVKAEPNDVWEAGFILSGGWCGEKGVYIWRQPMVGMCFARAMTISDYHIYLDLNEITDSFGDISSEVWVGFSEQVLNGSVWEEVNGSIRPNRRQVITHITAEKYRNQKYREAEEYLWTKGLR